MKRLVASALLGSGLTWLAAVGWTRSEALADRPLVADRGTELVAFSSSLGDARQQMTVIDPRTRAMSVYHIDPTGAVTLKSVRNIQWDLLMTEYNGKSPFPSEIRAMLEAK